LPFIDKAETLMPADGGPNVVNAAPPELCAIADPVAVIPKQAVMAKTDRFTVETPLVIVRRPLEDAPPWDRRA